MVSRSLQGRRPLLHATDGPLAMHHRLRIGLLFAVMGVGFLALGVRLVWLHVWIAPQLREIASEQHHSIVRLEAPRGNIYDRNGRVLATTRRVQSLYAQPPSIDDAADTARQLAPYLQRSPQELYAVLTREARFVYLARPVDDAVADAIAALDLPGIGLETEKRRYYPNAELASTVLGFTDIDTHGLDGMERRFDTVLRGTPGMQISVRDVNRRELPARTRIHQQPRPGADVTLTIDHVVQYHAERTLQRVLREQRAVSATAVVLDPATGAVLAMASLPDFDPNAPGKSPAAHRRNRTVTDMYEPGSVFKIVAATAALQAGLVHPETPIYCEEGWFRYSRHVVHDVHPMGVATFAQVIAESSNIGVIKVANLMAPEAFHTQIVAFGFGSKTDIGLAGETAGLYREPREWSGLSMAALPIGQEIGTSSIQLAVAYAALANDGIRMRPYIVREVRAADGTILEQAQPQAVAQVCDASTARIVRRLLKGVVDSGTGGNAAVPGYTVAGKTSTAQKFDAKTGRYSKEDYMAVFAGMVPVEHPRFVCVVAVDSPRKGKWGGEVAAPAFAEIARETMAHLEIPPDAPQTDAGPPVRLALHPAEQSEWPPEDYLTVGQMPDLTGRTMHEVLALFEPYAVHLRLEGSGLVVSQDPAAGAPLQSGMTCTVHCAPMDA